MAKENVVDSVETIEAEAEKLLQDARSKAEEIQLKAKEESKKILNSELSVADAEAECEATINRAREESDKIIRDSKTRADEIKTNAKGKTREFVSSIVAIITGEKA
jgi:vacuolar-type H+-ATPase subunit H